MEIAKALILAGRALDDRPWPIAPDGPKHLFPVGNRPILFHNLEAIRAAGVLEAAILVDPREATPIQRAVGDGSKWRLAVRYASYAPGDGVLGALTAGRDFVGDEPVLVQEGDALWRDLMHPHLAAFARDGIDALALRVDAPAEPKRPLPAPAHLLSPRAVSMLLDQADPDVSPVAGVRAGGGRVRVQAIDGCLPCHGGDDALLECNRRVLENLQRDITGVKLSDCRIQGAVAIDPTAELHRTTVRGPAIIGAGARLTDAYVGPYTSIGANAVIEGAELEYSIVLERGELRFLGTRLESSVIGVGARVGRGFRLPAALRMSIGPGADVALS